MCYSISVSSLFYYLDKTIEMKSQGNYIPLSDAKKISVIVYINYTVLVIKYLCLIAAKYFYVCCSDSLKQTKHCLTLNKYKTRMPLSKRSNIKVIILYYKNIVIINSTKLCTFILLSLQCFKYFFSIFVKNETTCCCCVDYSIRM